MPRRPKSRRSWKRASECAPGRAALLIGGASAGVFAVWIFGFAFVAQDAIYGVMILGPPATLVVALVAGIAAAHLANAARRAALGALD